MFFGFLYDWNENEPTAAVEMEILHDVSIGKEFE